MKSPATSRPDRAPESHPHPIQVAASRSGLTLDVLRAWEKRYRAVSPIRTAGGRRFYSDEDVARLQLLQQATQAGRRISEIAPLTLEELSGLVEEDRRAAASVSLSTEPVSESGTETAYGHAVAEALSAVHSLDAAGLDAVLNRASLRWSAPVMFEEVVAPVMREVGDRWMRGELRISHEHFATAVVRRRLADMADLVSAKPSRRIVVGTPSGQQHEIGALLAAAVAVGEGWAVTYLGADLPAEELAAAATQSGASAVALGLTYPLHDEGMEAQLRRLRSQLSPSAVIVAGGAGAFSYAETLSEIGAVMVGGLAEFRGLLRSIGQ